MKKILLIVVCLVAIVVIFILREIKRIESFDAEKQPWIEVSVPLPERYGDLKFLRRRLHPLMAEYSRKVLLVSQVGEQVDCMLPVNVGGRTLINLYWIDQMNDFDPLLLMRDRWGEYLVDFAKRETLRLVRVKDERIFAGRIDNESNGVGWETGTLKDGTQKLYVHVGHNAAKEITGYQIYERLQYLGRLDGRSSPLRFVSASEAPEEKIKMILR